MEEKHEKGIDEGLDTSVPVPSDKGAVPPPVLPLADDGVLPPIDSEDKKDGEDKEEKDAPVLEALLPPVTPPAPLRAEPETTWSFGVGQEGGSSAEENDKKGSGFGKFFAVFGGVIGSCLLLLVLTFVFDKSSFEFIKNVVTERIIYVREYDSASGLLTPNEAADKMKKSTVTVVVRTAAGTGLGSGFVYTADGYICTNYHVVDEAQGLQVILPSGMAVSASLVGYNIHADIAVLKVEAPETLVPVALGSSANLLVGDDVVAIGTPAHLGLTHTATFGTVSHTNRILALTDTTGAVYRKITVIQTDTSVNPGNSGGPLADMYGNVVGIVVRKVTYYGGSSYEGIGFAIPIDGAKVIIDAIIADGSFEGKNPVAEGPSRFGVSGHGGVEGVWYTIDAEGQTQVSDTEKEGYHYMARTGVYVFNVSGSNAQGLLQEGDIVIAVNGLNMYAVTDMIGFANRSYAGTTVTMTIFRGGKLMDVQIVLAEGPMS